MQNKKNKLKQLRGHTFMMSTKNDQVLKILKAIESSLKNKRIHNHVTNFKTLPLPPFCVDVINVKSLFYTTPKKNCLWIMFSQKSYVITTRQIWKLIKISGILNAVSDLAHAQPPFACSKLTIETLENEVNYVQRTSKC